MSLESRIQSLPQVLQDVIAEYNADHRLKMKAVFVEMQRTLCDSCQHVVDPRHQYVYYIAGNRVVCCSDWCKYDSESTARKNR